MPLVPVLVRRSFATVAFACAFAAASLAAEPADSAASDGLRDRFPAGSIDSVERADAAIAATKGAKGRVEKDFKDQARACLKAILVNQCLDRARDLQRRRTSEIDAVALEADRYKRRERADRLAADRAQRDAERAAKAPADAAQRGRNRDAYEARQVQASRDAKDRADAQSRRSASRPRKPSPPKSLGGDVSAEQRAKNADAFAAKQAEAVEHRAAIDRRVAAKAADRQRREAAKKEKDAKEAAKEAAREAAKVAAPAALPATSGTKP